MKPWLPLIAFMAIAFVCGCSGTMDSVSTFLHAGSRWSSAQTDDIRLRARELEARGEITMALDHWRQVHRIAIDRAAATREIERLENKLVEAVQAHYQKGLERLRKEDPDSARDHFLVALRLDPTFQPALKQIKTHFSPFPLAVYLSVPGDHPASVAKTVFGDEDKAFLVAWFNDLPEAMALSPGTLLILPKLKKTPQKKVRFKKPRTRLAAAGARMAANDIEGALSLAEQANPADPDVQVLIHTIHLKMATARIESGLLEDARQSLATVPDGFAGRDIVLEKLQALVNKRKMADAQANFNQGRYRRSLDGADAVLRDAPDHTNARYLAVEARYRLALEHVNHKRFLEARELLEKTDEGHEAGAALKETVRTRLAKLAQIHYRDGVKHFINEDLESAITEWEMALVFNPDHEKARENIENARRLMQKIETLP